MNGAYNTLKAEVKLELFNILDYWSNNTIDLKFGGFVGKVDHFNNVEENASKGIILNVRILWSFSAASSFLKTNDYKDVCERSYKYLKKFFNDENYKGLFWELNYKGEPINKRKQVYAQAFGIYALSEYYIFSKNDEAKKWAIELFELLEKYANDKLNLGYLEAFNEDWSFIKDMRLSNKDMNASKTMNTNLHVLEAYTSLLKIYDDKKLKQSLKTLVKLFLTKFLNSENHFDLFFDKDWNLLSNSISFGHDIETAWLLIEAAKLLDDKGLLKKTKAIATQITETHAKVASPIRNDTGDNGKMFGLGQRAKMKNMLPLKEEIYPISS